jgi:hypothetical protein
VPPLPLHLHTPTPTAELDEIYAAHYYDAWGMGDSTAHVAELKRRSFSRILRLMSARIGVCSGALLDLGCRSPLGSSEVVRFRALCSDWLCVKPGAKVIRHTPNVAQLARGAVSLERTWSAARSYCPANWMGADLEYRIY